MNTSRTHGCAALVPGEARGAERRRALLRGMVVSLDGAQSFGCSVRDISETGARIEVPRGTIVPARVYLITSRQPTAWNSRVVWRNAVQTGLAFAAEHRLSPDMDERLQFLWHLYLALGPRASNPFEF